VLPLSCVTGRRRSRHQHHPLRRQVDHAGALVDEDADGRQQIGVPAAMLAAATSARFI